MNWIAYCTLSSAVAVGVMTGAMPAAAQTPSSQAPVALPESALVKRAADLREQPAEASRSLGALAPQTLVTRLPERSGAWVRVTTAQGANGWLHIFDLTSAQGASSSNGGNVAAGALRGLTGLTGLFARGAAPTITSATSTVGIRGLNAEDLSRSQPNLYAVGQAESLRQDATQAQQFASRLQLQQRPLVMLPEPAPPPSATPVNPGASTGSGTMGGGS